MSQNDEKDVAKKAHDEYKDWRARGRPMNEVNAANVARRGRSIFGPLEEKTGACDSPDTCTCGKCRPAQ